MSDRNSMDDWQLQESPDSGDQWQLLDQEQNLSANLQLQEAPAGAAEQWRPVAYEEAPTRRTGWILPSMIIAALLAVLGYIGWLAYNGFEIGVPASPPPVTEPAESGASEPGVVAVATQTEAPPTATPLPPTATPLPEPTAAPTAVMVAQRVATILSPYGLNARLEPGGDGDVERILDEGETGVVVNEEGDWIEIELASGERFWISSSAELVQIATEMVEVTEGEAPPGAQEVPVAPADEAPTPQGGPTVSIDAAAGVNARSEPSVESEVLEIVPDGTTLPVIGVSDDGAWVQVTLEDGQAAWISTEVVTVEGELDSLTAPPAAATAAPEEESETAAEAPAATTEPAAEDVAEDVDPVVTIDNLIGSNARTEPSTTAETAAFVPGGTELPALGRSADSNWVQVELEDGSTAWIFSGSISLNVPLETLPDVE